MGARPPSSPPHPQEKKVQSQSRLRSSLRLRRVGCVDSLDNRIPIELLHHATALSSSILRETGSGFKRARDASPSGLASLPDCFFSLIASRYRDVGGFQAGKRNSRASAPFRFQTLRLASLTRGACIVAPQAVLLAVPDAPPRFFAHWARSASVPQGALGSGPPKPLAWDRSLPPPVAETGRRSVENRKECRLRHDYASFPGPPDSNPRFAHIDRVLS